MCICHLNFLKIHLNSNFFLKTIRKMTEKYYKRSKNMVMSRWLMKVNRKQEECLWTQDLFSAACLEAQEEHLWTQDLVNAVCVSEAQKSSQEQEPALVTMANAASLHTAEVCAAFSLGLKTISRPVLDQYQHCQWACINFHTPESLTPTAPNPIFRLQSEVNKTNMENNI